jgi:hypothetical protein
VRASSSTGCDAPWRHRRPSVVREETAPRRDEPTAVETPGLSCGGTGAVDDAELERAVAEIERAAAALRVDEAGSIAAGALNFSPADSMSSPPILRQRRKLICANTLTRHGRT